jgi:signal transduction histidine kinase/CheY-like chemotaxis protein
MKVSRLHSASTPSPTQLEAYYLALQRERARPMAPWIITAAIALSVFGLLHDNLLLPLPAIPNIPIRLAQIGLLVLLLAFLPTTLSRKIQLETLLLWTVIVFASFTSLIYTQIWDRPLLLSMNLSLLLGAIVLTQLTPRLTIAASCITLGIFFISQMGRDGSFKIVLSAGLFLLIWSGATIIASKILDTHNRRLFRFERQLYEINRIAVEAQDDETRLNQEKSRLLASMSHEIRTPLTAIMGFAESIKLDSKSYRDIQQAVDIIYRNGEYLLSLINDILDLSKVEAGKLPIEPRSIVLFDWLHKLSQTIDRLAANHHVRFKCDFQFPLPEQLIVDPIRLQQVLLNILSNAIKFSEAGCISLSVKAHDNLKVILFTVTDNGIGIDENTLHNLFRPFVQGNTNSSRRVSGSGLGLYISYQLVKRMGGDIKVHSASNQGSEFTVILPMNLPADCIWLDEEPICRIANQQMAQLQPLLGRVLIAEDQTDIQQLIKQLLQTIGLHVVIAQNGEEAVTYALQQEFHLILMDLQMPVLDGLAATKLIREAGCKATIIGLTAHEMSLDIQYLKKAGCAEVVTKPIQRESFYSVIYEHLSPMQNTITQQQQAIKVLEDSVLFNDVKYQYYANLKQDIQQLREKFNQVNIDVLKTTAHKIKGSASCFNLTQVSRCASDIEQALIHLERCFYYSIENMEQIINSATAGTHHVSR